MRAALAAILLFSTVALADEDVGATRAHAFLADPWLVVASLGAGVEPHDRGSIATDSAEVMPVAFGLAGEALWHGWIGAGLGLYASNGAGVLVVADGNNVAQPSLTDRISLVAAFALRPLATRATARDDWTERLLGGFGLELGVAAEIARTALDSGAAPGLHAMVFEDVPLYGGGNTPGLSLRLAVRLLVTAEQDLNPGPDGKAQSVADATALQFLAGVTYSL